MMLKVLFFDLFFSPLLYDWNVHYNVVYRIRLKEILKMIIFGVIVLRFFN